MRRWPSACSARWRRCGGYIMFSARSTTAGGAGARAVTLAPERAELAVTAARAVGAEYAGVDLLPARDGTVYVVEVNGIPGWRGLQEATSIDVAAAIVERVLGRVASR